MKIAVSRIDKIILLCRNVQRTSSLYSQALGLKVHLQGDGLCQLKDINDFTILLHESTSPAQLTKGYSPLLSFKIPSFTLVYDKLKRMGLLEDGQPVEYKGGRMATFQGLDGETIIIHDIEERRVEEEPIVELSQQDEQTRRILQKIIM